jgi:hypothetical protein
MRGVFKMRTRLLTGLLLAGVAVACARETPTPSQPPPAEQTAAAPATPGAEAPATAPGSAPAGGSALAPAPEDVPSAARGTAPAGTSARGAAPVAPEAPAAPAPPPAPRYREVTLAAGTELPLRLETALASDTSSVEDPVRASLRRDIVVDGTTVLPAGTDLRGAVTDVQRSGKVKGRASLSFRFSSFTLDDEAYDIRTSSVSRTAAGTKKKDAAKIGIGAGAGAIIGGIVGGKKGAAVGAGVGGGAGTGVVLATRGDEVEMAAGTPVTVTLRDAVTVRVPLR